MYIKVQLVPTWLRVIINTTAGALITNRGLTAVESEVARGRYCILLVC